MIITRTESCFSRWWGVCLFQESLTDQRRSTKNPKIRKKHIDGIVYCTVSSLNPYHSPVWFYFHCADVLHVACKTFIQPKMIPPLHRYKITKPLQRDNQKAVLGCGCVTFLFCQRLSVDSNFKRVESFSTATTQHNKVGYFPYFKRVHKLFAKNIIVCENFAACFQETTVKQMTVDILTVIIASSREWGKITSL